MKRSGFIYLWFDKEKNMYYLGSHMGTPDDGYIGSSVWLRNAYKKRPHTFKRRILESYEHIAPRELLLRENAWLNLISPEELGVKYYNFKKVAAGGNIVSFLSEEKKKLHAEKSGAASKKLWNEMSDEERERRRRTAFGGNAFSRDYMIKRNKQLLAKKAIVQYPNGNTEEITNISEFCSEKKLNYGNFKSMLRGGRHKSVSGITGRYL